MSDTSTYPLRLPRSVNAAAKKLVREEGISMNQFVASAVAEKLAVLQAVSFFADRQQRCGSGGLSQVAAARAVRRRTRATRASTD